MHLPLENRSRPVPRPLRGAMRLLHALGHSTLIEFPLKSGRRADIFALGQAGEIWIVEVKSGVPDFRCDRKWPEYREWCDRLFFAVGPEFPQDILPPDVGILIADEYEAIVLSDAEAMPLPSARRKALTLRFAHLAARRLYTPDDFLIGDADISRFALD
ncbi:MAG: MmcB family DNA repair protein [Chitinophagales bacterium]|nr:MmcB family DNA repair protein [Hyphomicrobiales bacterium]